MTRSPDSVVVLDAKGLRALAHPLRVQLVDLLRKHGPSTATRLAERLGVNSGTASYHLRRLGAAGFVEEDLERGNARERWWRSVHRVTQLTDDDGLSDREPEAVLAYMQSIAALYNLRTQHALNELQTMPQPWRGVLDLSSMPFRLTPEEALRLRADLTELFARYRRDGDEAPPEAVRVYLMTQVIPELDDPEEP
ncbi:ArsR/SmtB family transcription factor [Nonomuraea angiospora]|uniref:DNA-binding transcriptional ArsR family regulator n=1 Tax=Nonomuraea angiospora TaxID=46172 RepID=A0ABR9LX25_9ACTN|nr:winged helix-turn-helix domain-containing protein [Nonomuraea angiospora]MBE1584621.1 DNA-binding transcriptional ArsR family regulator [Nonomuraea angiospora]